MPLEKGVILLEKIFENLSLEIPKPVREEITVNIRQAILRGDFKTGDRLVETELASVMGVSRTPVREALRMLENEGLVRRAPRGGGVEVVGFSVDDILELYAIREALEVLAAEYSIQNISRDELEKLRDLVENTELLINNEEKPDELYSALNQFNRILLYSTRMPRLIKLISDYHEYLSSLRKFSLSTMERRRTVVREHREIIEAIEERDFQLTESIIRKHLRGALKAFLDGQERFVSSDRIKAEAVSN